MKWLKKKKKPTQTLSWGCNAEWKSFRLGVFFCTSGISRVFFSSSIRYYWFATLCRYQNIMSGWSKSHTLFWRVCVRARPFLLRWFLLFEIGAVYFQFFVRRPILMRYNNIVIRKNPLIFNAIFCFFPYFFWRVFIFFHIFLTNTCNKSTHWLCWNTHLMMKTELNLQKSRFKKLNPMEIR